MVGMVGKSDLDDSVGDGEARSTSAGDVPTSDDGGGGADGGEGEERPSKAAAGGDDRIRGNVYRIERILHVRRGPGGYPQVLVVRWHEGDYPDEWCKFACLSAAGKEAARRWERGALGVRARCVGRAAAVRWRRWHTLQAGETLD